MSLSLREREVMALVVSGRLNKQVAGELGISEITVKSHRGKKMRKMKVDSLADLVHTVAELNIAPEQDWRRNLDRYSLAPFVAGSTFLPERQEHPQVS